MLAWLLHDHPEQVAALVASVLLGAIALAPKLPAIRRFVADRKELGRLAFAAACASLSLIYTFLVFAIDYYAADLSLAIVESVYGFSFLYASSFAIFWLIGRARLVTLRPTITRALFSAGAGASALMALHLSGSHAHFIVPHIIDDTISTSIALAMSAILAWALYPHANRGARRASAEIAKLPLIAKLAAAAFPATMILFGVARDWPTLSSDLVKSILAASLASLVTAAAAYIAIHANRYWTEHTKRHRSRRPHYASEEIHRVAVGLRVRASVFRLAATLSFIITAFILICAMIMFWYAGQIAVDEQNAFLAKARDDLSVAREEVLNTFDTADGSRTSELLTEAAIRDWRRIILVEANSSTIRRAQQSDRAATASIAPDADSIARNLAETEVELPPAILVAEAPGFQTKLDRLSDAVREFAVQGGNIRLSILENLDPTASLAQHEDENEVAYITRSASTMVTRVSVAAFAIFLTQILLNLYRYSSRMAAFFDGRADALYLAGGKLQQQNFETVAESLAGEKIDFGAPPKSPADNLVELLRELTRLGWKPPAAGT